MNPRVSIIVTTRNEERVLGSLLKSITKQRYRVFETLVIDNASSDQTMAIARKFTRDVFQKGPERSAQRNFGAQKARGSYLLFLDADMVLEKDVLTECVVKIQQENVGAVIIPEKSFGVSFWARVKAYERSFYIGDVDIEAARFFKRSTFEEFGGFDEAITGPEDWDLSDRVKSRYDIDRIKSAILHNEGRLTLWTLVKKKYYYGKKTPQYLRKQKKPATFSAKTVFFFRRAFYKNPQKILAQPVLFCAMILMLSAELVAGVCGVCVGLFNERFLEK